MRSYPHIISLKTMLLWAEEARWEDVLWSKIQAYFAELGA